MSYEQQSIDFKWYIGELPNLFREYGHCFAIISNRKVVGTRTTYDDAVDAALELRAAGKLDTFTYRTKNR